jgi:hypothetical protein
VDSSRVFEDVQEIRDKFSDLQVQLRTLAPNTSALFSLAHNYMASLSLSAFYVGNIKNQFDDPDTRRVTVDSFRSMPTIKLAYGDLADSFAQPSSMFIQNTLQQHFDLAMKIIQTVTGKLMVMSDAELEKFFSQDKKIAPPTQDESSVSSAIESLANFITACKPLYAQSEQDDLLRSISQIQALSKAQAQRQAKLA